MGQFPSSTDNIPHQKINSISSFSRPSFLLPFFQQQQKSNNQYWLENNERKDFEEFAHRIFSYQTADGALDLPENYSQSTFNSLFQSLMKQLDKYLEYQPIFDNIDKNVIPLIPMLLTPKHIIQTYQSPQEKNQPFMDFILHIYDDIVLPKPTPQNIEIFLPLLNQFTSSADVYSPLLTTLLSNITSILLCDNSSSQKLCQILIQHLSNKQFSIYYIMAFIDAILSKPSLSTRVITELKADMTKTISYKPVNENIVRMRARLGENAIVQTACHYKQQSFILTNENQLYKVSTKAVKLLQIEKISSPARLAVNRCFLYVFQYPSKITIYDQTNHLSKTGSLSYKIPPLYELESVCTYGDKELFLLLFHQKDTNNYQLDFLDQTQITIGQLVFKKPPICMSVSHNFLKIATDKKLHFYEIDFDNFKIAPMVPCVINKPREWKLLSMQEETFFVMKPARSHLQLAYLKQNSPLSFLPEIGETFVPKDVIDYLLNDLIVKLSDVIWNMISEHSTTQDLSCYKINDNFIGYLVNLVKKAVNSQCDVDTLDHIVFVVMSLLIIHFNDDRPINEKNGELILDVLTTISKASSICYKSNILLTIFLMIDHCFSFVFQNNQEKLIEISKSICSNQQAKEQFTLFLPLLVSSPAILYLLDSDDIKILYQNSSTYTCLFLIQNSFQMLISEYVRCSKSNLDTSRLLVTLKVLTEATKEYFPKAILLMTFTLFLKILDEMKQTTLIVTFFEYIHPVIEYFDKKFNPDLIFSSGNDDAFPITEQTIETKHPVGNDNKYCWDISFPGAQSIEVEFDPSCAILIDDQDCFQILAGFSATSPIVYEREPKSMEPFPKKLYINSSCARVIFRSFAGYHLHGLKMTFRKIGNSSKNNEKVIDSYQFYIYYFFHCIGNCISTVFQENVENPKMNCCQFMLWMKKIEIPNDSLNKTQQICRMVPDSFMNMMLNETKATQRVKVTPEIQEIETLCVSAALHQLEITETVLNSKKFDENPNFRSTTKKLSTLMSPPYAGNTKKIRPTIIVPTNTVNAHTNQYLRQSLMTPKESQRLSNNSTNQMSTSDKVNSFLKMLWKLIYQMRTRIHYAKQKSKTQYETQLKTIRDKAKYFASVRSVFEPVSNYDSLEVLQTRANQILRVISSEFTLDEMFIYVKDHIQYQINQESMVKQLEKYAHEISHQHILMQIFYPLCKRLMSSPKISFPATTSAAFQILFQSLSRQFMHVDSQPDNSFQLMTLLSNFALVGFNESQSEAVFDAIKTFIGHNQNTIAWQLFIHYAMNVSTQLFEEKAKYFFESGIVGPTLLLQTLLILDKGNSVTNLSFVSGFINSKQPNLIRSIFLFLSAYYGKFGIQEDFSIRIENKNMESEQFFRFLLKLLGEKASGKPISLLPQEMPIESHMMIYSEITSFFRICIKKSSKVNDFLLRLFDTILLDFSKDIFDESIIGIFIVLGEGFFSLKASSYAIHDKALSVMKLEEYSMYVNQAKLKSLLNESISQIDTKRIIGYPRIPPNPSDFPMTKFRMNMIATIARQYKDINPVLFAAFSLYLNVLFQDKNSLEMIMSSFSSTNQMNSASFELVKSLLQIANESSFEGQYHSLPELIESASQYVFNNSEHDKLDKLIKLNSNAKIGNVLIDSTNYYYEFTLLDDIKTTDLMIGFISDDCTTNYHSFIALEMQKKLIVLNGIELRDSVMPITFSVDSTIGCLFANNNVSFIFNDKTLCNIPFPCHQYTPLILSSNSEFNYKINFGNEKFQYSLPTFQSEHEIIDVQYNLPKQNKTSNSMDLNDDDYLSFLLNNNPISNKYENETFEFKQADFAKPYFAHHKEIIESKSELCNYLQNVIGQPFLINSAFSPFDKKIGYLEKIDENRKFTLSILDTEVGKTHSVEFEESVLQKLPFHYFPIKSSSQVFKCLSIRAIRYTVLLIFNSYPNLYLDNEIIDRSIISDYLSKMICELIPDTKEIKRSMPNKGSESIFVSTLMFNSIISIPFYRNQLLNMFDQIIEKEKPEEEQVSIETNDIISSRQRRKRKEVKSQPGIISDLYKKLIQQIRLLISPSFYISEYNFLIETTHPLSYFRIDRTIKSYDATRFLIIANPQLNIQSRGLLIKGKINPILVNKSTDIESLVVGNELELNLSNNKIKDQFGCKINVIPQFLYSADSTFTPISFLIHFGINLLKITANKFIPDYEVNNELIPLLISNNNPILKLFRYQFLVPLLFTSQKLNEEKLYELCLPFLSNFDNKFSILNVKAQEEAIILVSSFVRLHASKFIEITKRQMKTTRKINQSNISLANNFSEFRKLMKSGNDFLKSLGHKRLEFVMYLLPFLRVDTLCPYFLFYRHYFEGSSSIYIIETQNSSMSQLLGLKSAKVNSPTKIESFGNPEIDQMYRSKYLYHLKFDSSKNQRIKFADSNEPIPSNLSVSFTSPKDPKLNVQINSRSSNLIHNCDSSDSNFHIHSDDFYIEINSSKKNESINSIPSIKMKIIPTIEDAQFPPQLVSEFLPKFLSDISIMNQSWFPHFDSYLSPHIKSSNIIASLPPTSLISLNMFPDHLIKSRFSFVKQLNELFNGELSQLPLNDISQPLVNLLVKASAAFSSAMKLSRLEKIICKNFKQKKSFSFNRSRALIAKTNPESPEAKSLFDQVIDQIPISSLSLLKCKDAPWRVTLEGEGATDVGGPGRDLFTEISSEVCMKHNHLFILTPRCIFDNQIEEYVPDPRCTDVDRFVYVGAFVALAFVTRLQQPYCFADLIWSYLSGRKVSLNHIYTIDPSFKTLITSTKQGEISGEDMKYTVKNIFGEDIELIPNGSTINVLSGNQNERQNELDKYCELAIRFRTNEFNAQLKKMKEGFAIFLGDICSQLVTPEELKSYICGSVDIPIQELRQLIQTTNATPEEEEMLYEVLEEFSVAERMLFIKFATGKMSVPAPGASWNGSLNVEFVKLKPKKPPYRLPLAATCSSTVSIPRYPTKEILASKLRTAITYGSDIVLDHAFDASGIIQ